MNDIYLIHYYYGDRLISFKTGLGTLIRAKGHLINVKAIIINNSFQWLKNFNQFREFNSIIYNISQSEEILSVLQNLIISLKNTVLLIVNFDLLIELGNISLKDFIELIIKKQKSLEILLTGEIEYTELKEIADYVSFLQSFE